MDNLDKDFDDDLDDEEIEGAAASPTKRGRLQENTDLNAMLQTVMTIVSLVKVNSSL